jgi:hypothetical protein
VAILIHADGSAEGLADASLSLERLHALVGGFVEFVYLGGAQNDRVVLIVNEDGHRLGLPINPTATHLYRGTPPRHDGVIVGPAIHARVLNAGQDDERVV